MMWIVAYGSGFIGMTLGIVVMALLQINREPSPADEIRDNIIYRAPERRRI